MESTPLPLVLDDVAPGTWDSFHEAGHSGAPLLPEALTKCWSRARALGAPAMGVPAEERLLRGEALRVHTDPIDVLRALGDSVLTQMAARASASQHVLLLADAGGVIVHVAGGGQFADTARRLRLIEGACWSEAARGTNAIGTAAEINRPTTVLGHAHFARPYQGLVCYAAPIRGLDGLPLAVIDATSTLAVADRTLAIAVTDAAHALEEIVRLRAYAGVGASVRRILVNSFDRLGGPALLVEAPGHVARANSAARELLSRDPIGSATTELLGLSFRELVEEARAGRTEGRIIAVGRLGVRVRGEPIEAPGGAALAVLVHLERVRHPVVAQTAAVPVVDSDPFDAIFAEDDAVIEAKRWARRLASSELPLMLLAETGAGKDLFAQAIHGASPRAGGPFVAVNCGAVAPGLLESELFGYAPGSFTGADRGGRSGFFQAASGGTLFLDEVAEMPPAMQIALLRVLETGVFRRVGAVRPEHTDARVICATCGDLTAMVARGQFRQDLYYRLSGAIVRLPPLRARSDVVALARHLLAARRPGTLLARSTEDWLAAYPWPGNVRQLRAALEVALLVAEQNAPFILPEHLPAEIQAFRTALGSPSSPFTRLPLPTVRIDDGPREALLARSEAEAAQRVLHESEWNISRAARELGVARSTLYRMVRRHGLHPAR